MIKAIETYYKGYRFRSRLEARWAVFFDALRIEWQYESEGYELSNGEHYLPDFFLPTFSDGMYCEVKPDGGDFSKARKFCFDSGHSIWLCEGTPDFKVYTVLKVEELQIFDENGDPIGKEHPEIIEIVGIPNADQAMNENRMFWTPGFQEEDGTILYKDPLGELFINAVYKARSARFEHGENGLG